MLPSSVRASFLRDDAYLQEAVTAHYDRHARARLVLPLLAGLGVLAALVPWGMAGRLFGAPLATALAWTLTGLLLVAISSLGTWRAVERLTRRGFNLPGVRTDWTFSAARVVYDLGGGAQQHSSSEWNLYTLVVHAPAGVWLHRSPSVVYFVPARAFASTDATAQVLDWARAAGVKVRASVPRPGFALAGAWGMATLLLLTVMTWICLAAAVEVTGARRVVFLFTSGLMTFLPLAPVAGAIALAVHWAVARAGFTGPGVHTATGAAWGAGLAFALEAHKAFLLDGPLLAADLVSGVPLTLGVVLGALAGLMIREFWTAGFQARRFTPPAPSSSAK
ncbi:MAG: hypothetical protein ABW051_11000 [Burkholderiaceae bacterium]